MAQADRSGAQRVVVVTGGGAGIGAAIAGEYGRQGAYVVTVDPMVTVDGSGSLDEEQTTAQRIVDAGGSARAVNASVTDRAGLDSLFKELVAEHGRLDAVVNPAGISRGTGIANGTEADWTILLDVHLQGYLNVLGAALPIMTEAGHGRILGFTSGSGWRPANVGGYSCAKRSVASLTWQLGKVLPDGVSVNALSPIAATRMVPGVAQTGQAANNPTATPGSTAGMSFGTFPQPESLGPVGAYLSSEQFSWSTGHAYFSGGSEAALIAPPHLLEIVRTRDAASLGSVFDAAVPGAFATAEAGQLSTGGANPRFGAIFDDAGAPAAGAGVCVVVSDDADWGAMVADALTRRGATCVGMGAWQAEGRDRIELHSGFDAGTAGLAAAADGAPIDAVVLALSGTSGRGAADDWRGVLTTHEGLPGVLLTDAGWLRAAADLAAQGPRPVRVVSIIDASTPGGRTRAQGVTQVTRGAKDGTEGRLAAFAIGVESTDAADHRATAELAAHLVVHPEAPALSGGEVVVSSGWVGLRSHPCPAGSVVFGGPAIPEWFDPAMRQLVAERSS